ncbi:MAG: TauD/TfdA family dioxygenase [Pseudomonadales bacterium]|nr:TauD/TfdA family dioxygenase [Pseudomonadales bacterium]
MRNQGSALLLSNLDPAEFQFEALIHAMSREYGNDTPRIDKLYEIRARPEKIETEKDNFLFPYWSSREQLLHTDSSFLDNPFDLVWLYCVDEGERGHTINTLKHVDEIVSDLSNADVELLKHPVFEFECGPRPILSGDTNPSIRFHLPELNEHKRSAYGNTYQQALTNLCLSASSPTTEFTFQRGDCLIIDNNRMLHGRSRVTDPARKVLRLRSDFV